MSDSSSPHIRAATLADLDGLSELLSVLFSQELEFTPDSVAQRRGLMRILGDPSLGLILLAVSGTRVLAMVNLLFTVSTALGERVALLEDMVVAPGARGAGLGSRLLDEAMSAARAAGCKRVTLLTDGDNQAAQRFYAMHGFSLSGMVPMRILL
ncbi:MAG: GNAT family N-acetyltransferase [Gammaproteobacteria bacterium]|nr:GNAT family N-acetyltransferase [Gammaproteobacteria bacterium]